MTPAEETLADLWATGTYGTHPVAHVRPWLAARKVLDRGGGQVRRRDAEVAVAGLVTHRQRPPTARGVVFISLEDETGLVNVICPPARLGTPPHDGHRAPALLIHGRVERTGGAVNLVAAALGPLRVTAAVPSRDFR